MIPLFKYLQGPFPFLRFIPLFHRFIVSFLYSMISLFPSFIPVPSGPQRSSSTSSEGQATEGMIHGSQVVAVGTALATSSLPLGAQQGPVMVSQDTLGQN
jgi:hypothetical protein